MVKISRTSNFNNHDHSSRCPCKTSKAISLWLILQLFPDHQVNPEFPSLIPILVSCVQDSLSAFSFWLFTFHFLLFTFCFLLCTFDFISLVILLFTLISLILSLYIPLPVKSANLRIFNCSIFLPKNVNFQGSGSAIFSAVWQITISGKFSSIFIPEIAKTDFERFEKPLTAANFLALSRRNY